MTAFRKKLLKFLEDRRGIAAVEFVLLMPIMMVMSFGLAEVYVEHATEDQFLRYVHQAGDLLSRETTLASGDITAVLSAADEMVKGFDSARQIQIHVASIGFRADATPTLLWARSAGGAAVIPDAADVAGMGLATDTIIRFEARMNYTSPFNYIWNSKSRSVASIAYFRPRETRAVSMDGVVSEYDPDWDYISAGG